jgi:hypothetical protein
VWQRWSSLRIPDKYNIDLSVLARLRRREVVRGHHHDRLAAPLLRRQI